MKFFVSCLVKNWLLLLDEHHCDSYPEEVINRDEIDVSAYSGLREVKAYVRMYVQTYVHTNRLVILQKS